MNQQTKCQNCAISPICFTLGLNPKGLQQVSNVIESQKLFHKGDDIHIPGQDFHGVFLLRSGCVKLYEVTESGDERIHGFYFPGDLFGFDAAGSDQHKYFAKAMETCSICAISLEKLCELASKLEPLRNQLFRLMSHELAYADHINLNTTAQQRVAKFLLIVSERMQRRGLSATQLTLSMSRDDIGKYLGLASETVSRVLKDLDKRALLRVKHREVEILDLPLLISIEQGVRS